MLRVVMLAFGRCKLESGGIKPFDRGRSGDCEGGRIKKMIQGAVVVVMGMCSSCRAGWRTRFQDEAIG
jgi:Fe-S cluster biogenesis protein NfuA